jgi:hypothetical protein
MKSDVRRFEQISVNKGKHATEEATQHTVHHARTQTSTKEKEKEKIKTGVSEYLPGGDCQNDGHVSAAGPSCRLLIGFLVLGLVRMLLSGRQFERRNSPERAGGWAAKEIFVM